MASTRFPGKPLTLISGEPMVCRVAKNVAEVFGIERTFVVTDSRLICESVERAGFNAIFEDGNYETGTDRIASTLERFSERDWIFNVQGDEPALAPKTIEFFVRRTHLSSRSVTNAFMESSETSRAESPNSIKVIVGPDGALRYASRRPIPYFSSGPVSYFLQVCIYGFRPRSLLLFRECRTKTFLERAEDIEILRFIDLGVEVEFIEVETASHPVDVPSDVAIVERIIAGGFGEDALEPND